MKEAVSLERKQRDAQRRCEALDELPFLLRWACYDTGADPAGVLGAYRTYRDQKTLEAGRPLSDREHERVVAVLEEAVLSRFHYMTDPPCEPRVRRTRFPRFVLRLAPEVPTYDEG